MLYNISAPAQILSGTHCIITGNGVGEVNLTVQKSVCVHVCECVCVCLCTLHFRIRKCVNVSFHAEGEMAFHAAFKTTGNSGERKTELRLRKIPFNGPPTPTSFLELQLTDLKITGVMIEPCILSEFPVVLNAASDLRLVSVNTAQPRS
jgi:hypothetical protein